MGVLFKLFIDVEEMLWFVFIADILLVFF